MLTGQSHRVTSACSTLECFSELIDLSPQAKLLMVCLLLVCVLFQMEERRDSMLETAFQCFQGASHCEGDSDEEEWLIHYMLGKIAEKRKQPPVEYLQLYKKVNRLFKNFSRKKPFLKTFWKTSLGNMTFKVYVCHYHKINISS